MSTSAETEIVLRTLREYKEKRQAAIAYMASQAPAEELERVQKLPTDALVSYFMEKFKIGQPMAKVHVPITFKHFAVFANVLSQQQINTVFAHMHAHVQTMGEPVSTNGLHMFLNTVFSIHDTVPVWKKILSIPTFEITDALLTKFGNQWFTLHDYSSRVYTAFLQKLQTILKAANETIPAHRLKAEERVFEARTALQKKGKDIRGAAALLPVLPRNVVSGISSYATGLSGNIMEQSKHASGVFKNTVLNEAAARQNARAEYVEKVFASYLPLGAEDRLDGIGYGFRAGLHSLYPAMPELSSELSIDDAIAMAETTLQAQIQDEMAQEANGMGGGSRRRHRKTRSCARKSKSKKTRRTRCRK